VTELVAHIWDLLQRLGALRNDAARASWLAAGRAPRAGEWFRAPGLARTLRQIAEGGAAAFYEGDAARAIVAASREHDGFFEMDDLRATHLDVGPADRDDVSRRRSARAAAERQGLAALQALNILECFDPAPPLSALDWHRRIEA